MSCRAIELLIVGVDSGNEILNWDYCINLSLSLNTQESETQICAAQWVFFPLVPYILSTLVLHARFMSWCWNYYVCHMLSNFVWLCIRSSVFDANSFVIPEVSTLCHARTAAGVEGQMFGQMVLGLSCTSKELSRNTIWL